MTDTDTSRLAAHLARDLPALAGLGELDPAPDGPVVVQLARYLTELHKWNQAYNLTAVRELPAMVPRHVLDSLSVLPWLLGDSVLDVGSGAGLPGIPLAICRPDIRFTLLDSNGKKTRFMQHVSALLALPNVSVVQSRVEQYAPAQPFSTVLCRAFTSLADFVQQCARLCAPGGRLLAMKGRYPHDELAGLPTVWLPADVQPLTVPGVEGERHLVILRCPG